VTAVETRPTTFTTSRLLDFFSTDELVTQAGHAVPDWPLVVAKELIDNSLDACEEAGVVPEVEVTVDGDGITVADNGPGIPPETVIGMLDYAVRVSSRKAYVGPSRGQQGNALKTLVAMPFVLDGDEGRVTVVGRGVRHEITVRVDPIRQEPLIDRKQYPADGKNGTRVTVWWPGSARSTLTYAESRFLQLVDTYAWVNPHLRLVVDWWGRRRVTEPTDTAWRKWGPSQPVPPHWYTREHLERLIAAYVTHDRHAGMTVRELVGQFRGLTGSAKGKAVLEATGMSRTALSDLVVDDRIDSAAVSRLLTAMTDRSRPVKPADLGVIGRDHLAARLETWGCEMESFSYKRHTGETAGVPWVVEAAFGWCPDLGYRRLVTGVNWSPGIGNPFRTMGPRNTSLDTLLAGQRVDEDCVVVVHLAAPRVTYTDRGKSAVVIA
jgi:DNA topoisomerase VI subunit B